MYQRIVMDGIRESLIRFSCENLKIVTPKLSLQTSAPHHDKIPLSLVSDISTFTDLDGPCRGGHQ